MHDNKASSQLKIWFQQSNKQVSLANTAGHIVQFDNLSVFPIKFPRLHYTIRSTIQKLKKQQNRLKRIQHERRLFGWHHHLTRLFNQDCIKSSTELIKYDFNKMYNEHLGWEVEPDKFNKTTFVDSNN